MRLPRGRVHTPGRTQTPCLGALPDHRERPRSACDPACTCRRRQHAHQSTAGALCHAARAALEVAQALIRIWNGVERQRLHRVMSRRGSTRAVPAASTTAHLKSFPPHGENERVARLQNARVPSVLLDSHAQQRQALAIASERRSTRAHDTWRIVKGGARAGTCSCGAMPPTSTGRIASKFCTHSGGTCAHNKRTSHAGRQTCHAPGTHFCQLEAHITPGRCTLEPVTPQRNWSTSLKRRGYARHGLCWRVGREFRTIQRTLRTKSSSK